MTKAMLELTAMQHGPQQSTLFFKEQVDRSEQREGEKHTQNKEPKPQTNPKPKDFVFQIAKLINLR